MPRGEIPLPIAPPLGGVRKDLPFHLVPQGFLPDAENTMVRDGVLITRPGFIQLVATGPGGRIMGGIFYKHSDLSNRIIAGTKTGWFEFSGSVWNDITSTNPLTGSDANHVRFAVFPQGGTTLSIGVNDKDSPKRWDGVVATYVDLGGSPPIAKDITVAANRVILAHVVEAGVRAPSRLRISDFNNAESWPGNLVVDLTDTPDTIVAAQALSRTAFAVLKDESQWIGVAQAGTFPFRFELVDTQPGPVSPAAVTTVAGANYYMGRDASFYKFDGIRAEHIGERIRRHIFDTLNFNVADRSWSVFRKRDRQIWWIYPGGTSLAPNRGVSLHIDTGRWEILRFGKNLTAGFQAEDLLTTDWDSLTGTWDTIDASFPTWDSFGGTIAPAELVGDDSGQVHNLGGSSTDDGVAIDSFWILPLQAVAGPAKLSRLDSLDTFFKKTASLVNAEISFGISDTLGADPVFNPTQLVDLSQDVRHQLTEVNLEGRFVTVKHRILTTVGGVEWRGGILFIDPKGLT